ncbi:DUF4112 domain-containing protein [Acidipila sp. 4G-K13]|uniref:DUF4112 domain-containing protein n=2 Tax=Paracidobacterium acidisoli TaxID=2303751 RepID=A0A372IQH1_9BACT|nr:DUF4112 domain-containing protein [Paracidobacterium acidisoli]
MQRPAQPEILPPEDDAAASEQREAAEPLRARLRGGGQFFSDENLDLLAHLLDDWFRIPGTPIRFGLDGLIGLVPGLGDVLAGLASCILIFAAWLRGVPYVALARMLVNLALDVLIGAIPFLGDAFDIAWKANRRNYALMTRHLRQPHRHTWKDYVFLALIGLVLAVIFVTPLLVLVWIAAWLLHRT